MREELIFQDPAADTPVMPWDEALHINSHGSRIFGRLLLPDFFDKESRCPVVLMLHGHPGGDKNLDIAAHLRAHGYAAVTFSYRGIWGSHGDYCLSHNIEDVISVVAYLRENADKYRIDPQRVYLFGHSMGGFASLNALATGLQVKKVFLLAPCNICYRQLFEKEKLAGLTQTKDSGYYHLERYTILEDELNEHENDWYFPNLVERLPRRDPRQAHAGENGSSGL